MKEDRAGGYSYLSKFMKYSMPNGVDFVLSENKATWGYAEKRYESSIKLANNTKWRFTDFKIPFVFAYVSSATSDVADHLFVSNEDVVCVLNTYPPEVVVSLRTRRDDIDLGGLASKFGGGGHPKAAAFKIKPEVLAGGYQKMMSMLNDKIDTDSSGDDDFPFE